MKKIITCRICKKKFEQLRPSQIVCSPECGLELVEKEKRKKAKSQKLEWNKAKREHKNNDKSYLTARAQSLINKYARLRDERQRGHICCTCNGKGKMDGGHFLPVLTHKSIRFNVNQIHQQCVKCNQHNSGMRHEYKIFMINKYGLEYVEQLEASKGALKSYSIEYLQRLIKITNKKINILTKSIDIIK